MVARHHMTHLAGDHEGEPVVGGVQAREAGVDRDLAAAAGHGIEVVCGGDIDVKGADLATHLARHKLQVELVRIPAADIDVASAILSHAADTDASLIVMGGYGHSKLRELALGGATRGIIESMTVPTLMSH